MGKPFRRMFISFIAGTLMLSVHASAVSAHRSATATGPVRTTGGLLPWDPDWPVQQSAAAHRMKRLGMTATGVRSAAGIRLAPLGLGEPPAALSLSTRQTARIVEPPGWGTDDRGKNYVDSNYWNACSAGAAAVAASYFIPDPFQVSGAYHEPYGPYSITTRWDASDVDSNLGFDAKARAYLLYMAMVVKPPSFDRPGIDDFSTYPTLGGSPQAIRDAVNWEISEHGANGNWLNWFYWTEPNSGSSFTQDHFNTEAVQDIWGFGAPLIVAVDADYLPNWPDLPKPLHHAITVVGYDNAAGTYTYLDTCGRQCGSTSNGGTHDISRKKLFKAMTMVGRLDSNGNTILRNDGTPRYPNGGYIW